VKLRIGTRASALALAQTGWVAQRIRDATPGIEVEIVRIKTSGDRIRDVSLAQVGGKGLFVKEIESALLAREIDCAVHSMKDLPGEIPAGLGVVAVPQREDPRDVLITCGPLRPALRSGMRVGTCSPRRAALLLAWGVGIEIVPLRGNVGTRLDKVRAGEVDATLLAAAGLRRLGLEPPNREALAPEKFVPAVGQGTLAIEARAGEFEDVLGVIEDPVSRIAADAERAFLIGVDGNCVTPLAAFARVAEGRVTLDAVIAHPTGAPILRERDSAPVAEAARLGSDLAERLLGRGGAELLRSLDLRP